MGGAAAKAHHVSNDEPVLAENEMCHADVTAVKVYKGSPATSSGHGYEVGYKIGEGTFAVVRVATQNKTKQKVALKEIYTGDLAPEQLEDLKMEINVLSQLRHPCIVRLFEVFKHNDSTYLVMEYLSGGELFDAICEQEYYRESDARKVMHSITGAILYCHNHGVTHRDLKPENLILVDNSPDTDVKLIDFGFATLFGPGIPKSTQLCGTPGYVAPEMLSGQPYGAEVDIWSLGVILYVLLAGIPPFASFDRDELYKLITTGQYSYPTEYWDGVSLEAKDLIDHMLVLNPKNRYTAKDVLKHPWMTGDAINDRDISKNLAAMRQWNASRRIKVSSLVVKSCIKFTLAGKRYRESFLAAARRARELEEKGISWELSLEEIEKAEHQHEQLTSPKLSVAALNGHKSPSKSDIVSSRHVELTSK